MEEQFRIVFDVGGDVSVGTLAGIFADFDVVTQAALGLAARAAEAAADERLALLVQDGGLPSLLEEARRRELSASFNEGDLELPETGPEDRVAVSGRPSRPVGPGQIQLKPDRADGPWARLAVQLRSSVVDDLLPARPYRFSYVHYETPLVLDIVSSTGIAARPLKVLLWLVRDLGPHRRITQVSRVDVTDGAFSRMQLRALAVRRLCEAVPVLGSDVVRDLLSDGRVDAVERLAAREPSVEHSALPDE